MLDTKIFLARHFRFSMPRAEDHPEKKTKLILLHQHESHLAGVRKTASKYHTQEDWQVRVASLKVTSAPLLRGITPHIENGMGRSHKDAELTLRQMRTGNWEPAHENDRTASGIGQRQSFRQYMPWIWRLLFRRTG